MLKIYLARHGQDIDNANSILNGRRDELLSIQGIKQADKLAEKIKHAQIIFNVVYSSPLQRAYKTAEIITEKLGIKNLEILDFLIERDFGVMTGKPIDKIKELCAPNILQTDTICYFLNPERAETFPQLLIRATEALRIINNKHKEGNILLVTHGDIGKMIYAAYHDLNWQEVLKLFHFGNAELLELSQKI